MSDDSKEIGRDLSKEETLNKSPLRRSPRISNNSSNSHSNETSTRTLRSKRLSFTENSNLKHTNNTQETSSDQEASIPRRVTRSQTKNEQENTLKLNPIEEETDVSENMTNTQPEDEERNSENGSQETQTDCKLSNALNDSSNTTLNSEENSSKQALINKENGLETSQLDDSKHSDHDSITFSSAPVSIINTNVKVIDNENNREEPKPTELPDTEMVTDGKTDTSAPVSIINTNVKVLDDENNREESMLTELPDTEKITDDKTDTSAPVSIINTNVKVIDNENNREESMLTELPDTEMITDGKTDTSAPVSIINTNVKVIDNENNREESNLTELPDTTEKIEDNKTDTSAPVSIINTNDENNKESKLAELSDTENMRDEENGLETSQLDDSDCNDNTDTSAPVSTLKTDVKVIDDENDREETKLNELPDTEKIKDKEKQGDKTETIKQKYSQLIDSTDIDYKIDELLSVTCTTDDEESEDNHNEFLDSMAEEGEEDTPSEGSNDIVEVGEEINTTESELSTDESYESNSFIDDEEECRLLSGDEYDLSLEEPKKKSRIIQLNCESDDEIIKIERPKKEIKKKPKKSRIIRIQDSSDEDVEIDVTTVENEESSNKEETVIEDIQVANSKKEITSDSKDTDKDVTPRSSTPIKTHEICETVRNIDSEIGNIDTNNEQQSNSNDISTSSGPVFVNITMQIVGQKVNVIKNVNIEDTGKLPLNEHVKDIIDSLSSSIDDASEISVKLSAHYLDENVPTNDESKNNLSEKKIKINSEEVSTSKETLRDYFKTMSQQDLKPHQQSVEVAKSRGTKRKLVTPTNNNEDSFQEAPVVKKKKKNKKKQHRKSSGNGVQMGILDEVLASNKTDVAFITNDDWDVEDVAVKPVRFNKSQTKNKESKLEKNGNSALKKFSAKDFKNSMLFDSSRVNRVQTKQVLKKKGIQLHHF